MLRLLNDGWEFVKLPPGGDVSAVSGDNWRPVALPHDWLIGQARDLYEDGDGWYRRALIAPEDFADRTWLLRFDGVYMDCDVLLNGRLLATHRYGYTAFDVDLTPALRAGENQITVRVRHRAPNSRWYSGAGIFRDVTLCALPKRHVAPDGLYISCAPAEGGAWRVTVDVELEGPGAGGAIRLTLADADGRAVDSAALIDAGDALTAGLTVPGPRLWSCADPYLYALTCELDGQRIERRVGLRRAEFDPDRGFLLNGESVKLHGVCLHHDLGALGAAFNAAAFRRQLRLMKRMGVNALRTSHNPPAARALDICDEEGVLVIDEAFDMWLIPKTPNDYARFFPDCWEGDVRAWVRRDRGHPCVIMWSVGNEIPDVHVSPDAPALTAKLKAAVEAHDPRGNARATQGSNYMPWAGAQRCADVLKIAGYNYAERYYDAHHARHPDWVIYGSETASVLSSRGVYHFPADVKILSEEDMQCSALMNSVTSWGAQDMRRCIVDDLNTPYTLGQFLWSGIDYIGEPTPYHTRSCYFGMVDTAGFEKDGYYLVKSLWSPEPTVHIGVSWDWNPGQLIDVPVYANGARCELFVNGRSLGAQELNGHDPQRCAARWPRVPFEAGTLEAVCYDASGNVTARDARRTPGDSARLMLSADRAALAADGEDAAFVTVTALDAAGNPVDNAVDRVRVTVEGAARLLGLDNGDSTDPDGYRVSCRRLFGGKLLAIVGATDAAGEAVVRAEAEGLGTAEIKLTCLPAEGREGHGFAPVPLTDVTDENGGIEVRRIELTATEGTVLTPGHPEAVFRARALPESARVFPIEYRVVNVQGIESPCAEVMPVPGGVCVAGRGDGEVFLRAVCKNGASHARVISQLELRLSGFGGASLDPYGFVSGGLYDMSEGDITPGNDKGIAFARDGWSMAGFSHVDFGPVGSDELELPVFAPDGDAYEIALYLGHPKDGGRLLAKLPYQKPSVWNVYQAERWTLPERLTGVQTLCFAMDRKLHLKGFRFIRQSRAWLPQRAGDADAVYGDSFIRSGGAVKEIGNNVSLVFRGMDFGAGGPARLTIIGHTPLASNPVQVRFEDAAGETSVAECPFAGGDAPGEQTFELTAPKGLCDVTFVFLPGCRFDFEGFRFSGGE